MDSNNLYQNQQTGMEPDNNQTENVYQSSDAYQTGNAYQSSDAYQTGNAYQSGDAYQNDGTYQQPAYNQGGSYNNGGYANNNYANGYNNGNYNSGNGYNNGNYNGGNYSNGNYNNNYGGGYGNNSYQPYQPSQLDLEEPVKMSEWLISLLLMMVPCVNIVMMFVWAFSKTEKKSKSNFFKAQLIMVGVVFALYMVILIIAVAAGLMY